MLEKRARLRRSGCRYVLAGLAVLALCGALSMGGVGCSTSGYDRTDSSFAANLRQSPGELDRLRRNAHYYKLMGRPELALAELEQARRQDPDNLALVDVLAQYYEELREFEAARQLYREALARHDAQPILANNLCFSYYLQGRWSEAETCFRRTLARDPQNAAARNNLGLLYCRLGRLAEARRLWQEAEGEAAAGHKLGQALAALGMTEAPVYAQAEKSGPPTPERAASPPVRSAALTRPLAPPPVAAPAPIAAVSNRQSTPAAAPRAPAHPAAPKPPLPSPAAAPAAQSPPPRPPAPALSASPRPAPAHLTCAELVDTAIEVRNGTRSHNLARETRSLLSREGFTVAKIGNHIDFGADRTIIYYRPGAERVAQTLGRTIFPGATLSPSLKLKPDVAVKILLGADLLGRSPLMARLAAAGEG
ncbi:MAG: tetratricopeptide repeat protein [Desulfobaccales bacterium]